ncbi:type I glyceraldehyde-3-phosphate dehydrogenase [Candidatus Uhrbacteria bacterium CG_4_9_14_0_2_um_filter_41_50]|uniref:Type I glyceraldehyde-3-phosphate dehydrogenase n=2 Tax=Parcubacteria group TaxID=1794811 RepID=A0A2M8ENH2_9BACT|nr:MAG: type I glyceraldehyde-3-phosphate dehydrogenase [Candidatus Uhrbacteria bacterium CG_4_10_14_3_um_filter_41_21]PIZ54897.1 MAG: type I glyceraldehyde-3-phosphate dehydrogenase [Candidatus Uhrbacteria bacterium CG_4_10_14_0_2_um_filter_41_21]PJB84514.1 MAG: type I glyceraldehyde-3-phosphate dehydrogenase [Candidatus Uhrbacteria bacterium CG_4_9_14_0_8_um_filter_41_16]PJC24268.1 MAG: type I glyceraldehyde-3-phosphate dehydrogenase [Candidatus Uhrbacteria bacterium CG_4_9_14_0_2_um_filter_41
MARIAINGFGRIGRSTFKAAWGKRGFQVVAINDLTDAATLAHLLKYDSNYGKWEVPVASAKGMLIVAGKKIPVLSEKDPAALPWKKMKIDVVIESTGFFTTEEKASAHLDAGAKRVVLSAPGKGGHIPTYVLGANAEDIKNDKSGIVNNASCTTNCVAPVTAIMAQAFGVKKAMLTTIHGYTSTQNLVDGPHKDLRRARAAAINMIPTSTGAAIAVTETLPSLKNAFDGLSIRVPLSTVSISDITFLLSKKVTVAQVNRAIKKASTTPRFKNIVGVTEEPLVSSDFIGDPRSAIVDLDLTRVVDGDLVKVVAWYDNEWGYANRLAELAVMLVKRF